MKELILTVSVMLTAAIATSNDDVCFGDLSLSGKGVGAYQRGSHRICASGPSTLVSDYLKARKASFEEPDSAAVESRRANVVFTIPATAYGRANFTMPAKKIVFTKKGTKDAVLTVPVTSTEVPLSNTFGKEVTGFEGRAEVAVEEFRRALDPSKGEFDFNLTFDTDKPEWALFTDKWKQPYFEKLMK